MATLEVTVNGLRLPNPFVIASGPPGTNANVIAKAFDEGWGAVVSKTACLDAGRIVNVSPRYARLRVGGPHAASRNGHGPAGEIVGWENIELISDRPFEDWLDDFKRLKKQYPDRILIASITEGCSRRAWEEIVERTQATGVDALELNFSCPHGLPERKMGSAIGQDADLVREICGWVRRVSRVPVWAKMTPNITDIAAPARAAIEAGCDGISAINTVLSIMEVNLETLRPEPAVDGFSTAGGYSGRAIRPIALRMASQVARVIEQAAGAGAQRRPTLSAMGGIESGGDAAQFILLGAACVQVCTGVMIHGYRLIRRLTAELEAFMDRHGFGSIDEFRARSLHYLTSHSELVRIQRGARADGPRANGEIVVRADSHWTADRFVQQSDQLAR
ncbi:MAG: NAD-dependent dihydropyrimidine dehydrogenase subunit PreA [Phycisphaerales bacterium]